MSAQQLDFLAAGAQRLQMTESIELTIQSMQAYGPEHDHWGIAWSGGKDSTATLTIVCWLIDTGRIAAPKTLTVFYADTRQELPPLAISAMKIMDELRDRRIQVEVVRAPLDKRFMVYILGRGVPPPNNNTLRWCTRQIKIDPMEEALRRRLDGVDGGILMITGVRQGESAIRDRRIEMSCGKDGAECGQGWYQQVLPNARGLRGRIATLAPLLHWRVCHVWEWLKHWAPEADFGDWSTRAIADAYGGDEAEELNARTGCIGCPLAQEEKALETVLRSSQWSYLAPLRGIKPLWRELREPHHRLRKPGLEKLKGGGVAKNPQRLGPLTFEARLMALDRILSIQNECNRVAHATGRPMIDLIDAEEEARIRELIAARTWPQGWEGDEPTGDVILDVVYANGAVQPRLFSEEEYV
ncbi:phosphoadenosine phosphosulfate reductase domain-containing protein [Burkholderia cenocepacia]|uniref:phosphoadenosine phosphosulfate reductase domain-containing protein n=1 Tax=Burkholderia cenocepacia TaxID=95486 RepID=UPI0013DE9107|nr:phosphoadenosine phosphosulfate reductase family protein [Burkholderia cenocepacia]MCW3581575.1 phosphoadenosine phosphosulfate reductase family protein [Burkholderia cenocepacia]MCW3626851.1 phosphoadenosine phosphosulfate reductase family protein [Burkholderia cenocepacia]MCW5178987.1 phosphoadenosine phosphosulfate reductase family protein [Burkholderia cenocepacia]NGO96227.1 phosphoadenosine phosphosulfate reductase [Burkholderia cenocepacia]